MPATGETAREESASIVRTSWGAVAICAFLSAETALGAVWGVRAGPPGDGGAGPVHGRPDAVTSADEAVASR